MKISGSVSGKGKIFNAKASKDLFDRVRLTLEVVGVMVEGQAKLLCPVKTGRLRASIFSKVLKAIAIIGTAVKYAVFVEFGTRFMAAQSFLRAAIDKLRKQILRLFRKAIREAMGGK